MAYLQKKPDGDQEPVFNMGQLDFFRYDDLLTFIDRISIVVLGRGPMMSGESDITNAATLFQALNTLYRNILPFVGKRTKLSEEKVAEVGKNLQDAEKVLGSIQNSYIYLGRIPPGSAARLCRLLAETHSGILMLKQDLNLGAPLKPASGGIRSEINKALGEDE